MMENLSMESMDGDGGIRTHDLDAADVALSRSSYAPKDEVKWTASDSNRQPSGCKPGAPPIELPAHELRINESIEPRVDDGIRTRDLRIGGATLYH